MPASRAELAFALGRPFEEQVAFFRGKLGKLMPTERWDDLWKSQHDRAFMVAGAAIADLLADLAAAVDKVIAEGETLQQFRKRFFEIVRRHGWSGWTGDDRKNPEDPKDTGGAGTAWRTRVIYRTNMATSYAAGRLAQLKSFPVWVYRHGGSRDPRPEHLSWNGLTLPADHEFWKTHYPPSAFNCSCYVTGALSRDMARHVGGDPDYDAPPAGWDAIDPQTGEPPGIGKGWGYMPGGTVVDTVRALSGKLDKLPAQPSIAVIQDWLRAAAFAAWYEAPSGTWPLARLPDADAAALGAQEGVRVAHISEETAVKQRQRHPDITPQDYAQAQAIIDSATAKAEVVNPETGTRSMIYVREDERIVMVVKATLDGQRLYVTTLYRLSADEARSNAEVRRLLRRSQKK